MSKKSIKLVLDTSVFVNPDSQRAFGKTPADALDNFLTAVKEKKHITCYIPPSVYEELMKFMEKPLPPHKTVLINKKPPASYVTPIPALFLYEFIEELRLRVNKGLRIAEKYSRKSSGSSEGAHNDPVIKSLREEYRIALREGILDSKEDFDLILLAYELTAHLATSDHGLIKWAQKLGIPCLQTEELKEILTNKEL